MREMEDCAMYVCVCFGGGCGRCEEYFRTRTQQTRTLYDILYTILILIFNLTNEPSQAKPPCLADVLLVPPWQLRARARREQHQPAAAVAAACGCVCRVGVGGGVYK